MNITEGGLDKDDVRELIQQHFAESHANTPEGFAYVLDLGALKQGDVRFYCVREEGVLLVFGALKALTPTHGEIKSMRTADAARGRGVGGKMLRHLLSVARSRGYHRVSLETGSSDDYIAARRLYEAAGFVRGEAFADYVPSEHNWFYHFEL